MRKLRKRRKAGLAVFALSLPLKRLEQVVRQRENLPDSAPVTKRQIHLALMEGIHHWSQPWIALRRVTRNGPK